MHFSLQTLISAMPIYKYGLLFVLVMIEGPFVTMLAGWAAFLGYMNPFLAYFIILCADMASDCVYYAIGFVGRRKFMKDETSAASRKFKKIEHLLLHHSRKTLIISKLTHVAGVPFLIAAGMAKLRFTIFFLYDFIPTIPKSLVFILLGYYFGKSAGIINQYLEYGTMLISALVIVIFVAYVLLGRYFDAKLMKQKG